MLAYFTVVKLFIGSGSMLRKIGIVALCLVSLPDLVQAESGSSQAVMALIVPPHAVTLTAEPQPDPSSLPQPFYNHEATVQVTQQVGNSTRQIWVTF